MKPKYTIYIENSRSAFDAAEQGVVIQELVSKIIEDKSYTKIINSPVPLYVHIKANSKQGDLDQYIHDNKKVYVKVSSDIENDFIIIAIINRLIRITLPTSLNNCFIEISTTEPSHKNKVERTTKDDDYVAPTYVGKESSVTFDDVILPVDTKDRIIKALSIIKYRDLIFKQWGFEKVDKATKSIICFYGEPGTGKTRTSEAIGNYLGKKIIFSTYANIESHYVGIGAKNLHAIFKAAEDQDAILFFDEADSFLSSRLAKSESSSDKHYNRMTNEMFQLLEQFNGCVIFATNLLTDVDDAFKSRIIDSIRFKLPDRDARRQMIHYMLPNEFPLENELTEGDWTQLLDISDGFSGRDIRKSILLSLAHAAILNAETHIENYSFEVILEGFKDVQLSRNQMDAEISDNRLRRGNRYGDAVDGQISVDEIDPSIGQYLLDQQVFNEKMVSMARLALNSDEYPDAQAVSIYKETTFLITGITQEDYSLRPNDAVSSVCENVNTIEQKIKLLDIAVKIITADGRISENKEEFIKNVLANLSVKTEFVDKMLSYVQSIASANKIFLDMNSQLFS